MFSSETCNNFRNINFEENLWTTASECYYNGGKILKNTSTSCEVCFLGAVKSNKKKKKKLFFYHWYENFKPFGCAWFWVAVGGFGCFWVVACFTTNAVMHSSKLKNVCIKTRSNEDWDNYKKQINFCVSLPWNTKKDCTAWKVSKYGVFSGPYFPTFGLNTERYSAFGHFSRNEPYDPRKLRILKFLRYV